MSNMSYDNIESQKNKAKYRKYSSENLENAVLEKPPVG